MWERKRAGIEVFLPRGAREHTAQRGGEERLVDVRGVAEPLSRRAYLPPIGEGAPAGGPDLLYLDRRIIDLPRRLLYAEDSLPNCFGLLRLGELGRAEELDHVVEGGRHVIGQHVARAGMSGINPSELRSAQPGLGSLVIVEDVAEGSVEVACHYRGQSVQGPRGRPCHG